MESGRIISVLRLSIHFRFVEVISRGDDIGVS